MAGPFWSLLTSLGAGINVFAVLYVLVGFALVRSVALSVLAFLALGGWDALRTVLRIVYRDFRYIKTIYPLLNVVANFKKNKKSIGDVFSETVSRHPDKPAIIFEDQCWSFRQLDCFANQVGHYFLKHGLKKGDTVAMFMENCPEFVGTWLGLSKIGVKASFINCNLRKAALLHCLNVCQSKAIVYTASLGNGLKAVHGDLDDTLQRNCFSLEGDDLLLLASSNLETEMESMSTDAPPHGASDDIVFFIYTSGTTGLPKAVPISMNKLFSSGVGYSLLLGCHSQDNVYCTLPLYHTVASVNTTSMVFYTGATLVMRRKFLASQFWNDCVKHKCTIVIYIGEICRYLLTQPDRPSDTKHCIRVATGSGLRPQIWEKFQNRFNIPLIIESYGSTEGNALCMNTTGKVGSCGFMLLIGENKKILKIDPETKELLQDSNGRYIQAGINEPGEMVGRITKATPFIGYTDQAATRKKILQDVFEKGDGYARSGDLMRMDEEGYLYFCDRLGDTYRWKGENVSATEVEGAMVTILGPREVVVFGVDVPGAEGKAGMACIVGDEESVDVEGLAEKVFHFLPPYAVPRFVRLIQQADLTGTFRFQKTRLCKEGYDKEKTTDPVFILDTAERSYVPLDEDKYLLLQNGEHRL